MSNVTVTPSQQLRGILLNNGLEDERAGLIAEKFNEYFLQGNEWAEKAKTILVTSSEQVSEMKQAREGRLFLKQRRVGIENLRKTLKERSLTEGRAIDLIAKHLTSLVEPTERYLEQQETFPIREKARLRRELVDGRLERLKPFEAGASESDLATWTEEEFVDYLNVSRERYDVAQHQKHEQEKQREFEAREKEELRKANERLAKELREQQAQNFAVTQKLEVQQETLQETQRELGNVRKGLNDFVNRQAEELEEQRQNSAASDKEKLTKLASSLSRAAIPHVESREAADILDRVEQMLTEIETFIQREAAKL